MQDRVDTGLDQLGLILLIGMSPKEITPHHCP